MNTNYEILYYEVNSTLAVEMPAHVPLGFNPSADDFDWAEVYPANYWSLELLNEIKAAGKPDPVVTPHMIKLQPVYDPEQPPQMRDMRPKIVMYFKENVPALVMNKSRCQLASEMTGTRDPKQWVPALKLPIVLKKGEKNNRLQIVFDWADVKDRKNTQARQLIPEPAEEQPIEVEDINQVLGLS